MVDHRRFGAMSSARAKRSGGRGGSHVWPTGPAVCAVAVCVGACASQPAALEAWRVLVWLITGKHAGREARGGHSKRYPQNKVAPARRSPLARPSALRAHVRAQPPPHAEHRRARDDRHPSPSINARHPSSTAAAASSASTITHTRPRARLPFQCAPLNLHALARTFVRGCAPRGRP